jgi:uracil-DNA glycosylase
MWPTRSSIASKGWVVDAREQLRRYLEQRRDAGETELVLDGLDVEDVLRLVGVRAGITRKPVPPGESPRPAAEPPPEGADWRDVLRQRGAAPEKNAPVPASPPPQPRAAEPTASAASSPIAETPAGISVGAAAGELFSVFAHLNSLEEIAATVATCTRCPLHATALNPVPGTGNARADLMIVGEAPGATEDEQGVPFVGAAGQLLTKILASPGVELKREDVFIVNVLKHRPPGNRNPMPDEVTACSPYLFRQFELIRPKAILALGTFAAQTLLQTKLAIGKLRGQVHRFHGVPLIVTYHPAALLRNPSWKRPTWEDVQLVRRILDSSGTVA